MSKAVEKSALAVCLALSTVGHCAAHSRRAPRPRQVFSRRDYACPPGSGSCGDNGVAAGECPTPDYAQLAREGRPVAPDFAVQYGCVIHPELASGSLGAMLQGRNPTAGDIP
jgi:hypothetical protein